MPSATDKLRVITESPLAEGCGSEITNKTDKADGKEKGALTFKVRATTSDSSDRIHEVKAWHYASLTGLSVEEAKQMSEIELYALAMTMLGWNMEHTISLADAREKLGF